MLGKQRTVAVLEHLSLFFLRDFMLPTMASTIDHLKLLPYILKQADSSLNDLLQDVEPFYALSSILTLFSHDIESFEDTCIIFDYIFASGSMVVPLYLYASMVMSRKEELVALETDDCDILHSTLSNFPSPISSNALFDVTARASILLELYPPQKLENWDIISSYSVLKTTAAPQLPGRRYSNAQDADIQRRRRSSTQHRTTALRPLELDTLVSEEDARVELEHATDNDTEEELVDSVSTVNSMLDPLSPESLFSPDDSTIESVSAITETDDDQSTHSDATATNQQSPVGIKKYSIKDTVLLMELQIKEADVKAEEERQRKLKQAEERKKKLEQQRAEKARLAEEKANASLIGGRFSRGSGLGLISSATIMEVFPTITKGSGALVHHITRNLRATTQVLAPNTIVGLSLYFGLFSILAYACYYNPALFNGTGFPRWLDFKVVWEKMVARYFH